MANPPDINSFMEQEFPGYMLRQSVKLADQAINSVLMDWICSGSVEACLQGRRIGR